MNELDCDRAEGDNVAQVGIDAVNGTTYLIRVAGPEDATNEEVTLSVAGPNTRRDVWYWYRPSSSGEASVTLSGSSLSTIISVHSDCSGTSDSEVGSDDTDGSTQGAVTWQATAQEAYLIRVAVPVLGTITPTLTLTGPAATEWIGDLTVTLESPTGTVVTLVENQCNTANPSEGPITLDDAADAAVDAACPVPADTTVRPVGSLAAFNNEDPTGTWTLRVTDNTNKNIGDLLDWKLQICTEEVVPTVNGNVANAPVAGFMDTGVIDQLFRVPGTYVYTLNTPSEQFGGGQVTGQGGSANIIVEGERKNQVDHWMRYE